MKTLLCLEIRANHRALHCSRQQTVLTIIAPWVTDPFTPRLLWTMNSWSERCRTCPAGGKQERQNFSKWDTEISHLFEQSPRLPSTSLSVKRWFLKWTNVFPKQVISHSHFQILNVALSERREYRSKVAQPSSPTSRVGVTHNKQLTFHSSMPVLRHSQSQFWDRKPTLSTQSDMWGGAVGGCTLTTTSFLGFNTFLATAVHETEQVQQEGNRRGALLWHAVQGASAESAGLIQAHTASPTELVVTEKTSLRKDNKPRKMCEKQPCRHRGRGRNGKQGAPGAELPCSPWGDQGRTRAYPQPLESSTPQETPVPQLGQDAGAGRQAQEQAMASGFVLALVLHHSTQF